MARQDGDYGAGLGMVTFDGARGDLSGTQWHASQTIVRTRAKEDHP